MNGRIFIGEFGKLKHQRRFLGAYLDVMLEQFDSYTLDEPDTSYKNSRRCY